MNTKEFKRLLTQKILVFVDGSYDIYIFFAFHRVIFDDIPLRFCTKALLRCKFVFANKKKPGATSCMVINIVTITKRCIYYGCDFLELEYNYE